MGRSGTWSRDLGGIYNYNDDLGMNTPKIKKISRFSNDLIKTELDVLSSKSFYYITWVFTTPGTSDSDWCYRCQFVIFPDLRSLVL